MRLGGWVESLDLETGFIEDTVCPQNFIPPIKQGCRKGGGGVGGQI